MASTARSKVLVLQHAVYPYRLPMFEALARDYELVLRFCVARKPNRSWAVPDLSRLPFDAAVLPRLTFGMVFNYTLGRLLTREHFDVIVGAALDRITLPQLVVLVRYARRAGTPFVFWDEFFETEWYQRNRRLSLPLNRFVRRWLYRHVDAFAVHNEPAKRYLVAAGVNIQKVHWGRHWYPVVFANERPRPSLPPIAICVANLTARKGIDLLIESFKTIELDARLVIIGEGEARQDLERRARGDTRVTFAGYLEGEAKRQWFERASLLVLPSLYDPWGLVVNEAMAAGLPVITTTAAGAAYGLADNSTGAVVPPGDIAALRGALVRLLIDPDLRRRCGDEGVRRVAGLTLEEGVRPLEEAIEDARTSHGLKSRNV